MSEQLVEKYMNKSLAVTLSALVLYGASTAANAQDSEPPTFQEHPGFCLLHNLAPPLLTVESPYWPLRTRIREATNGACTNFDGAFTIVEWGCGTECQNGVMVDRTDGKLYDLPEGGASLDYEYHAESNLLIVNAHLSSKNNDTGDLEREFYVFEHGKWREIYRDYGTP